MLLSGCQSMYPEKMQSSKSQYAGPLTDLHGRQCESLPKKGWIIILNANVNLSMCLQHLGDGPHHVCQIYMNCLAVTPYMDGSTLVMCNRGIYILYIHVYIYTYALYFIHILYNYIARAHSLMGSHASHPLCTHTHRKAHFLCHVTVTHWRLNANYTLL
jgi:hypothetical protein